MGAFKVAADTNCAVVPITIMGTGDLMPPGSEFSLATAAPPVIVVNEEIAATASHTAEDLRDLAFDSMQAALSARRGSASD